LFNFTDVPETSGRISLKLKSVAVVTLLVIGCCFASAQTFGFASVGGGLYCNYEQFTSLSAGALGGFDNLSACGASVNAVISGFNVNLPAMGQPTGGAGVVYGDSIYAAYSGNPFAMWTVFSRLKCNKADRYGKYLGSYGWVGAAAFSGYYIGGNTGYLSCSVPNKAGAVSSKGPSFRAKK
jgi:hypothetical protein